MSKIVQTDWDEYSVEEDNEDTTTVTISLEQFIAMANTLDALRKKTHCPCCGALIEGDVDE